MNRTSVVAMFAPSARFVRTIAVALSLAASALLATPSASAQFGRGMMGNMDEPSIDSREIERYAEMLQFTPEQLENAKGMLEGFNTEFTTVRQEMRTAFEAMRDEARETGDNTIWRDAGKLMQGFQGKIEKAEKAYFDDLKLLLTEEQAAKWPAVERARRREKSVPQGGILSGEAVDLVRILKREMKLPAEEIAPVQPLMDQYELELDRVLAERDKALQEGMSQGANLWMNQQMDKIEELFNKTRDASAKVKEVNKRYARQIEAGLPEARHAEFEREVQKASFPRVYRPNYVTRSFDTALGMEDLSEEQRTQITAIKTSFEQQVEPIQAKLAASIESTEMTRSAMQMFGMGGGGGNEGAADLRDQRRELEEKTFDKIKETLNDEQKAKLPERPRGGNWRNMIPGGGPGGRGGDRPARGGDQPRNNQ
ncbi:MAG: hypothetical protein ACKVZJ_02945 [Phycisphaerales bacterium]